MRWQEILENRVISFITCTISEFLDIRCPVSYLNHKVSETGFCLRLQVKASLRNFVVNKNRRMDVSKNSIL
jgi:hypothetical protein